MCRARHGAAGKDNDKDVWLSALRLLFPIRWRNPAQFDPPVELTACSTAFGASNCSRLKSL